MPLVTRKLSFFWLLIIALVLFLSSVPGWAADSPPDPEKTAIPNQTPAQVAEQSPTYNDCALFIGGLSNPQGPLAAEENRPAWVRYARFISQSWNRFDRSHLTPMKEWAAKELSTANTATVFYPFSGPDFVNMYTLFPHARTYLMIALEPVGHIPEFAAAPENQFFPQLQLTLYDLLQLNFFITNKLRTSLKGSQLKGILPVLLFFLARENTRVLDVRYWVMKPDGAIEETPATAPGKIAPGDVGGVCLDFASLGSQEKQTLYYFSFNLANDSLRQHENFVSFLKGFGPLTTFAKAASYLMHKPGFSGIRQFILAQSLFVLAGDSAVPVRYFDRDVWKLKFYGTYTSPIALFQDFQQNDLAEIYRQRAEVYPLPFGIDYRHRLNTSNLMFASKKQVFAAKDPK